MQRLARKGEPVAGSAPIHRVAHQRVVDVLEMHADLVRPPGIELAFHERRMAEALEYAISGARGFPAMRDRHAGARAHIAANGRIDEATRRWITLYQRQIDAVHRALGELVCEARLRRDVFRHDEKAARVLV